LRPRLFVFIDDYFALRLDHEFAVRFLNGEKAKTVAKKIGALGTRRRPWLDAQLALRHAVVR